MRTIDLSTRLLSEAVWGRIFEHSAARYRDEGRGLFDALGGLDALRVKAQYNTGSIGTAAQWALYALANLWSPAVVAEVGTFIGKSAVSIARGCDAAGIESAIHTCDMSNTFELPVLSRSRVIQYPGSASTQMLSEMVEDGLVGKVDLFHIDGRLSKEDVGLMLQLASPDAIVALDDFEGIEKGVANLFNLRAAGAFSGHCTIYPPSETLLRRFGFWDHALAALLVPRNLLRFTAQ